MQASEETAVLNREQLAQIMDQAPVGLCAAAAPSLRIIAANQTYAALAEAPESASLLNTHPADYGADTLTRRLLPLLQQAADTGRAVDRVEIRIMDAAGPQIYAVKCDPLHRPDGSVWAVLATVLDITERKSTEEALRDSEARIRAIVSTAVEGIITIDERGVIESFNRAASAIFGYTPPEVTGKNVRVLMPEPYRSHHDRYINNYVTTGKAKIIGIGREVVGLRKDGTIFPMDLAVSEVRLGERRIFTGIVRDITERKQAEEALHQARRQAEAAYEREHRIAARFQRALLPRGRVRVPGYAVAHTYRPALIEADVGGDFYNIFAIDERRVALVVGDVGGKGLDAAVIAARVQHSLMTLAIDKRRQPGSALEIVRQVTTTFEEPDQIITLFFGILDRQTGRLRYASAGHEPVLLWQAAQARLTDLPASGPALFGIALEPIATEEITLVIGDLLFLYTDGLPDAHACRSHTLLGTARIRELLTEQHAAEPATIIEAMYQAALIHSGGYLRDDIALVALRRLNRGAATPEPVFISPPRMGQRLQLRTGGE